MTDLPGSGIGSTGEPVMNPLRHFPLLGIQHGEHPVEVDIVGIDRQTRIPTTRQTSYSTNEQSAAAHMPGLPFPSSETAP